MLQEIRQKHMQIAQFVLPTINQWHSQGPPQLLQPRVVPCDRVINSSGNTIAVTQPQKPTSQVPYLQPITSGNVVAASMGKIGLAQNNSISAASCTIISSITAKTSPKPVGTLRYNQKSSTNP